MNENTNEIVEKGKSVREYLQELLGISAAGSASYQAAKTTHGGIREWLNYLKDRKGYAEGIGSSKNYKARAGDIRVYSPVDDLVFNLESILYGNPAANHAEMLVKGPDGQLRSTHPYAWEMSKRFYGAPGSLAFLQTIGRQPQKLFTNPLQFIQDVRNRRQRLLDMGQRHYERVAPELLQNAYAHKGLYHHAGRDGVVRVLRPKVPLTKAEQKQLYENAQRAVGMMASEEDMIAQGLRRLTGISEKDARPSVCIGGVCDTYTGVRQMPDHSKAIGLDLLNLDDFETVYSTKMQPDKLKVMDRVMTSRALGRLGLAGGLGALAYSVFPDFQKNSSVAGAVADVVTPVASVATKKPLSQRLMDLTEKHPNVTTAGLMGGSGSLLGLLLGSDDNLLVDSATGGAVGLTAFGSAHGADRLRKFIIDKLPPQNEKILMEQLGDAYTPVNNVISRIGRKFGLTRKSMSSFPGLAVMLLGTALPTAGAYAAMPD